MFDYSLAHWVTFIAAGLALEFVPGPSMLYMLGQAGRHGRGHGLVALAGVLTGSLLHVTLTVCGLAAIIARSAAVFTVIKWIGAAYLVWLGIQSMRAARGDTHGAVRVPMPPSRWRAYRQGVLIDLFNPKTALFFVAFIPQFVVPGAGPVAAQLALHGLLLLALATICDTPIVLIGARLMAAFRGRQRLARWSERGLGAIFIGLGARLAMIQR